MNIIFIHLTKTNVQNSESPCIIIAMGSSICHLQKEKKKIVEPLYDELSKCPIINLKRCIVKHTACHYVKIDFSNSYSK